MSEERIVSSENWREALELLNELCEDSLEVPLNHVDGMTDSELKEYGTSAKFKRLRDLILLGT